MRKLESGLSLVGGAALGAALMYLLDPDAGRRRREELTDSASNALSGTGEALSSTWETVAERARNVGGALAGHAQHLSDNASHLAGHASKLIDRAGNVTSDSADTVSGWGQGLARQARHLTSPWVTERAASARAPPMQLTLKIAAPPSLATPPRRWARVVWDWV